MEKRLYRSRTDKVVGGVCGGLGEYFNIDPVFVRVIAVILALFTEGIGFLAYIIAWIIVPKQEIDVAVEPAAPAQEVETSEWKKYFPGIVLIGIGLLLLAKDMWYWFHWEDFWPVFLIIAGLFLVFRKGYKVKKTEGEADPVDANSQPNTENGGSPS